MAHEVETNPAKQPPAMDVAKEAQTALQHLALTLYECPDGSLANSPKDCRQPIGAILPSVHVG